MEAPRSRRLCSCPAPAALSAVAAGPLGASSPHCCAVGGPPLAWQEAAGKLPAGALALVALRLKNAPGNLLMASAKSTVAI
jgi:hypothetical protein